MLGWTGGQYSLLRVALAACVAGVCVSRLPHAGSIAAVLLWLTLALALALALGWRGRPVALALIAIFVLVVGPIDGAPLVLPLPDVVFTLAGLVFHATVPPAPFGAWDARGRIDPGGDWQRPVWSLELARWTLVLLLGLRAWLAPFPDAATPPALDHLAVPAAAIGVGVAVLFALAPRHSAWAPRLWLVLVLWQIACASALGWSAGDGALLVLHAFAVDPGWWPGTSLARASRDGMAAVTPGSGLTPDQERPARLFYDGDCGFCHNSVRVVLAEEVATPPALRIRFAPLAGETFAREIATRPDVDPDALPDSIVLVLEDRRVLTRAAAALEIAGRLGGLWRAIALVGQRFPRAPLDGLYDLIARIRTRLFPKPDDACPILPPDLRARFDA